MSSSISKIDQSTSVGAYQHTPVNGSGVSFNSAPDRNPENSPHNQLQVRCVTPIRNGIRIDYKTTSHKPRKAHRVVDLPVWEIRI